MISTDTSSSNKSFDKENRDFDFGDMERPDGNFKPNDSNGGRNSK